MSREVDGDQAKSFSSSSPKAPQSRPVWVKPCNTTSGGPEPRTSTWSGTSSERTGHVQRHPGGRVGPLRRHRCGDLPGLAVDATRAGARPLACRSHVRLDERSAGFYALGLALATGRPTVICVTSGTAAAELHPAVVEAHHARVPLIVCTADRPPELLDTGAPQTIDQVGLFTTATRWSSNPGVPTAEQAPVWRPLAARRLRGGDARALRARTCPPQPGVPGATDGHARPSARSARADVAPRRRTRPGPDFAPLRATASSSSAD